MSNSGYTDIPIKCIRVFLFFILVSVFFSFNASARVDLTDANSNSESSDDSKSDSDDSKVKKTGNTIFDTLSSITCETQGVGDLLRTEFSHTCIPASFFSFVVANIVSPGLYANTLLRVNMNDKEMFPNNCDRSNRIDFNDQKLSFSMCNNIELAKERIGAVAKTVAVIAKSQITGDDPWASIGNVWDLPKSKYHKKFLDKREGDQGSMWDVGIIPWFPWKILKDKDKMCVGTRAFGGWVQIGCKYIKEPYPISIYSDFLDVSPEGAKDANKVTSLAKCGNMGGCYKRAYDNSKATIVMSGPLIECVKEMSAKLMISNSVCNFDDIKNLMGSSTRRSSALFQFQVNMHKIVSASLTIYVILFGFRMVLSGNVPQKSELTTFLFKFLFVVYFSVGINITPGSTDDLYRMDGMIQWVLPFLLNGMDALAGWIINASPSKLCDFSKVYYPDSLQHLRLWDALDCRVSHYLGLDMAQTMIVENASRNHDFSKLDVMSFPIPPYVYLLIPAIISGIPSLISLALMYPLLIISVAAFVVNATVVCIISIVILGVLAPLFVPMFLFNYTKGYFDAWVKLLMSFMLQPMVVVVFMTTLFSVYDFGFYGKCKYVHKDFAYSESSFDMSNTVDLESPAKDGNGSRGTRYFYIDQEWTNYTEEEERQCKDSLGFMLNNPFQAVYDIGEKTINKAIKSDAIVSAPGTYFSLVTVIFDKIKTLINAMLIACFILYLMYHFSEQLARFAADMTEGVSVGNMAIKPQTLFKAGMKLASSATGAASKGGDMAKDKAVAGARGGAKDMVAAGGGGGAAGAGALAKDAVSTARDALPSGDKVSTEKSSDDSDSSSNSNSSDSSSSRESSGEDKDKSED
ncbi:type IV secretion system protein [Rickettsiaceae bacterium]|nr:type IV secretion system protein [Rickettsiaceae bacterium]